MYFRHISLYTVKVCLALICVTTCHGENLDWRWSNPQPHGNNILDMEFHNGLYVQVTERGRIYTSRDLTTWSLRESGTTNFLRAVGFLGDRIVIAGESGTVLWADSPDQFNRVDLGTSDWLEDVAASANLAVAVGDNGAVYTSSNGIQWQRQSSGVTDWLRSVSFGTPNGTGKFIAVGESGTVLSSANGAQWQKVTPFTGQDLNHVNWIGNQFWALGDAGSAFISNDGSAWYSVSTGATNDLFATARSPEHMLIAGAAEVRSLPWTIRGAPWSDELSAADSFPAPVWTYFSSLWDGTSFLVAGRTGMMAEGFKNPDTNSTDPIVWLPLDDSIRNWLWDVRRFSDLYIAVGDRATVMTSPDGVDWTLELVPNSATNSIFLGIGGRTNLAVAVGNGGSIIISPETFQTVTTTNTDGTVTSNEVSTLGIMWKQGYVSTRPTTNDLHGVAAFGDRIILCGGNGTVLSSTDGTNWQNHVTRVGSFLSAAESYPGGVVLSGDKGTILTSSDGQNWIKRETGTTNWIYRVRHVGGKLIGVGQNGTILTSSDSGVSWQQQNSGTSRWLNDIHWIDGSFYIAGTQGTLLRSADSIHWTPLGTITEKSFYGLSSNGGQLVVVGTEGIILRTQIVPNTTPIFVQFDHLHSTHSNVATNQFIFSGQADQKFTLERTSELNQWSAGPQFEFLNSSELIFYSETVTNPPPREFFRARLQP